MCKVKVQHTRTLTKPQQQYYNPSATQRLRNALRGDNYLKINRVHPHIMDHVCQV